MRIAFLALLATLILPLRGVSAAEPLAGAEWIRDPRFRGQPLLDVFEAQERKMKSTELKNVHTYFRKEFALPEQAARAQLCFSADDYAKVYLNGRLAAQGPEPAYPFAQPYYRADVTGMLQPGSNCVAVHTYYHGLVCRAFNSADNRSGLILRLDITLPDGSQQTLLSDGTWKCFASGTFSSDRTFGYATQFNENIDLTREPVGWRLAGFDVSPWAAVWIDRQDHAFVEPISPPLERRRVEPVMCREKGPGRWVVDFGTEVVGHTRIRVKGSRGHVMTVWHGEELSAPENRFQLPVERLNQPKPAGDGNRPAIDSATVRHNMRCNCDYVDKITLSGADDLVEFYEYRGFRYVELIDAPGKPEVWVEVRHHPFDWEASHFASSSETLNRIWEISKRGVQMGCQGVIVDCPTREKGQYTGDTYMTVVSHLLLTADATLTKKAILDWHHSQRFDPGMLCVAPGGFRQELAEWSLLWPIMLQYYYRVTADESLVNRMAEDGALESLMDYFQKLENADGLLEGVDRHKWVLVDWPANLRGGYDYEATKNGVNTVVNAFYYGSLRAAGELMRIAGRDDSRYDQRADGVRKAMNERLFDARNGVYIDGIHEDGTPSHKSTLHASVFALHFGVAREADASRIVELIRRERLNCGIYAAPYLLSGLWNVGEAELAYDLLTCTDKHSWHEMLRSGATTTMEAWAPELKWNTSWCHPAGGTPVWLVLDRLMGLRPAAPGFRALRVTPQFPEDLQWIEVRFPTASGTVEARYEKGKNYRVTVPEGMRVIDDTPHSIELTVIHKRRAVP